MLSKKMVDSINEQINWEIFSGYLYLGMSSYASSEGYMGIANWFSIQVKEELSHAQMMYDYVNQQGGRLEKEAPLNVSNLMLICPSCDNPARAKVRRQADGTRLRKCHRCGEVIEENRS